MKISVNDKHLFELSEIQKKVICNDIDQDIFDKDIKRRWHYVLTHKYARCFARLKQEWDSKLAANGVEAVPTNADAYAQLVFAQPNYKCRKTRDAESALIRE